MAPTSTLVGKIKVQLKLAISRLRMVQQKDTALAKQQRRAMAQLLEQGKEESARIRVENIIRADLTTELLEMLELYCELLLARAGLLEAKECDAGLVEAVASLVHAAPRTEIRELQAARALLLEKYGKELALRSAENPEAHVAPRVLDRLRVEPPPPELVQRYLEEIARTYGVDWPRGRLERERREREGGGDDNDNNNDEPGDGAKEPAGKGKAAPAAAALEAPLTTDELSRATPPRDVGGPKSPVHVAPPQPRTDNVSPRVKLPEPPELKPGSKLAGATAAAAAAKKTDAAEADAGAGGSASDKKGAPVGGKIPDVDELSRRFAALKK